MWITTSKLMAMPLALGVLAFTAGHFFPPVRAGMESCNRGDNQPRPQPDKQSKVTETHRILVLDIQHERAGGNHDLRLIEVESSKVLARLDDIGLHTDLAVSSRGDVVAV